MTTRRTVLLTLATLGGCTLGPGKLGDLPGVTDGDGDATDPTGGAPTTAGEPTTAGVPPVDTTDDTTGDTTGDAPVDTTTGTTAADMPADPPPPTCEDLGTCDQLDVLLVINNSGTMAGRQQQIADGFQALVAGLRDLHDVRGEPVGADVQIMVTTTDVGHPLCAPFNKADYEPAAGAPIATPCTTRLERFNSLDGKDKIPGVCIDNCPVGVVAVPQDPFIRFDPDGDNVLDPDGVGDPAADALACIGLQGIDGCGFEAPLEATLQALAPTAAWNQGPAPFLRPGAALAVVIVSDETDCSALDLDYFDPKLKDDPEFSKYWELAPSGEKSEPTSAVCWNASMTCDPPDAAGVHASCVAEDREALQPMARYTGRLRDELAGAAGKPVYMLLLTGVPPVTAHSPDPPFEPTEGGVLALVHRLWRAEDILPNESETPAQNDFEFGIGPGCVASTGAALPPGRLRDVCEALDMADDPDTPASERELRCCIESLCDPDFAPAFACLAGMLGRRMHAEP